MLFVFDVTFVCGNELVNEGRAKASANTLEEAIEILKKELTPNFPNDGRTQAIVLELRKMSIDMTPTVIIPKR